MHIYYIHIYIYMYIYIHIYIYGLPGAPWLTYILQATYFVLLLSTYVPHYIFISYYDYMLLVTKPVTRRGCLDQIYQCSIQPEGILTSHGPIGQDYQCWSKA